jgi:hypothetical protein
LRDLILKDLWRLQLLQYLVLAEAKEAFEEVLGNREADDELLPWKEWPVECLG